MRSLLDRVRADDDPLYKAIRAAYGREYRAIAIRFGRRFSANFCRSRFGSHRRKAEVTKRIEEMLAHSRSVLTANHIQLSFRD